MLNWAVNATKGSNGDLLELYCGNGNFTIPLAQNFGQVGICLAIAEHFVLCYVNLQATVD